ncbi:hypothetical protein ACIXKQ_06355 [Bacteroides fragilis]|nr:MULTISPECIES: hypothetical protein [Bacteroides]UVP48270.1 hypothetical protein NXX41_09150 [Bacteroides fragilis]UVR62401.1 hypothetical protein NXV70_09590 [Bacteroides fragilis]UVR62486.1 hypothetical protein NXV70_10060 [Bacteroides fragilis]
MEDLFFGAITGKTRKKSPVFRNKKRKNRVWSEQKQKQPSWQELGCFYL